MFELLGVCVGIAWCSYYMVLVLYDVGIARRQCLS